MLRLPIWQRQQGEVALLVITLIIRLAQPSTATTDGSNVVNMAARSPIQSFGYVRLAVGVGLLTAPRKLTNVGDPTGLLLMRTIGVRDLVLGLGSILAGPEGRQTWAQMTLLSDSVDVVVGTASIKSVGLSGGLVAALLPVPFAAAGVRALKCESQEARTSPR